MKKLIIICVVLSNFLFIHGQENIKENMIIHLDKDCYIAGEDIWMKLFVFDGNNRPSVLSKVGYIEICDTKKPHVQHKFVLENGCGSGRVKIPQNTPTGTYLLSGYTRFMKNEESNAFFHQTIAIINVNQDSELDRVVLVDSLPEDPLRTEPSDFKTSTEEAEYATRSKVTLTLSQLPVGLVDFVVSVVRDDKSAFISTSKVGNLFSSNSVGQSVLKEKWLPEHEGHIITGEFIPLTDENDKMDYSLLTSSIGFVGKDIRYIEGQINPQKNQSIFYCGNIFGVQEIVTSVSSLNNQSYRLDLLSPFESRLPSKLPPLSIIAQHESLLERSAGIQLNHILFTESFEQFPVNESYYNIQESLSYDLDEYTRFNTLSETIIEFVRRISISKTNGKRTIKVFLEGEKRLNEGNTLILLDGIPILEHEDILNYNPRNLKKINIYSGRYIFGGKIYDCMVSFLTIKGNLPSIQLNKSSQLFVYECPSLPQEFKAPTYESMAEKDSRKPDFRHTLYWNPFLNGVPNQTITLFFYTSDLKGNYRVIAEGTTQDGRKVSSTSSFVVR